METTAPTYLEALKKSEAYSDSPQKIKFEETQGSYLFHANAQLYKIKKTGFFDFIELSVCMKQVGTLGFLKFNFLGRIRISLRFFQGF